MVFTSPYPTTNNLPINRQGKNEAHKSKQKAIRKNVSLTFLPSSSVFFFSVSSLHGEQPLATTLSFRSLPSLLLTYALLSSKEKRKGERRKTKVGPTPNAD